MSSQEGPPPAMEHRGRSRSRSPPSRGRGGGRRRSPSYSRSRSRSPPHRQRRSRSPRGRPRRRSRSRSWSRSRSRSPRGGGRFNRDWGPPRDGGDRDRRFPPFGNRYGGPGGGGGGRGDGRGDHFGRGHDLGFRGGPPAPPYDRYSSGPTGRGPPPRSRDGGGGGHNGGGHGGGGGGGRHRGDEGPPGVSLLVRNVSGAITTEDLQRAFGRIGEVRDVYIPRDYFSQQLKGYAFVEYATIEKATEAREEMDRFVVRGRELEVVFAQERRKTPGEMRSRGGPPTDGGDGGGGGNGRGPAEFERSSSFERHRQRQRDGEHHGRNPDQDGRPHQDKGETAPQAKDESKPPLAEASDV